jgi:uncharacterized protein YndB with AHSA1/START domain
VSTLEHPGLTATPPARDQHRPSRARRAAADLAAAALDAGAEAFAARRRLLTARLHRPSASPVPARVAVGPDTPDHIERALLLEEPVERVWRLLTDPKHLGSWLGDGEPAVIDLRPGGRIEVRARAGAWISGHIVHLDPPSRLSYRRSHPAPGVSTTTVEVTLDPHGAGCRLRLVESGTPAAPPRGAAPVDRAAAWTSALRRLSGYTAMTRDEILDAVAALPVSRWSYRGERVRHVGPMAQDWARSLRLGRAGDTLIPVVDAVGVLLVCVKALYRRQTALDTRLRALEDRNADPAAPPVRAEPYIARGVEPTGPYAGTPR